MQIDLAAVQMELQEIDTFISEGCLQLMRIERAIQVANGGITGFACADGLYNRATADACDRIHFVQHLLKLNGTAFLLGLDPQQYTGRQRQYLESARFALLYDLEKAFYELKKGSSVFLLSHAPNCGQRAHFAISLREMLLATHRSHEVVARELKIDHNLILPAVMVDREYGSTAGKPLELYVIKHKLVRRYGS